MLDQATKDTKDTKRGTFEWTSYFKDSFNNLYANESRNIF